MTREEKVLNSLLQHPLLKEKYGLSIASQITLDQAINSEERIIKLLALLSQKATNIHNSKSDKEFLREIMKELNS